MIRPVILNLILAVLSFCNLPWIQGCSITNSAQGIGAVNTNVMSTLSRFSDSGSDSNPRSFGNYQLETERQFQALFAVSPPLIR